MRIFIALDIPDDIRARMMECLERARSLAPEARWARPESLHVTLKFVGEVSDTRLHEMKTALSAVKAAPSIAVTEEGAAHEQVVFVEANWIEC
jgi:2'-5' RNA ligase